MLALCLADLHSSRTALERLDAFLGRNAADLGVVLAAGDITIPGHEAYAAEFIALIARYGVPLLLVHGNNDTRDATDLFVREGVTIHRREREVAGVRFVGIGGDGTAPWDTELGPDESLDLRLDGAILLTHVPPRNGLRYVRDDRGTSLAPPSSSTGHPLLANAPRAHVCGHVHRLEGVAYIGPTKVVKVGAAMWNACALLDLRTLATQFIRIDPAAVPRSRRRAPGATGWRSSR